MKSKKQFFMGIALVLTFAILVGLVLPWLMSAKSTIAVLIALAIIVCIVAGLVYVGKKGAWHQFAKIEELGEIWCEVLTEDLRMLEETVDKD
jgi:uncharacterized membrane protein